jgi:hypothetical protein
LTDSEVRGAILQGLPGQEQRAAALQGVGTTNVVGKDGNPRVAFTPDAVGKQPYIKDTQADRGELQDARRPRRHGFAQRQRQVDGHADGRRAARPAARPTAPTCKATRTDWPWPLARRTASKQLVDLALTDQTSKRLRDIVTKNPAVQGLVGAIRGTVQDVIAAGGEVGQLFDVNMKKMQEDIAAGRVDPAVAKKFANFDPNIPAT